MEKFKGLKEAIKETGYLICPIIVAPYKGDGDIGTLKSFNGQWFEIQNDKDIKYIIIDGQHRLAACRELTEEGDAIDIHFVINSNATREDVILANNSASPWSLNDYIKYNYEKRSDKYVQLVNVWKGAPVLDGNMETIEDGRCYGRIKRDTDNSWEEDFNEGNVSDAYYKTVFSEDGKQLTHTNAVKKGVYNIDLKKGYAILKTVQDLMSLPNQKRSKLLRGIRSLYIKHPKTFNGKDLFKYINDNNIKLISRDRQSVIDEQLLNAFYAQHDRGRDRNFSDIQKEIIKEKDGTCQVWKHEGCDGGKTMEPDHILSYKDGGETNISNGQWLCQPCNRSKSAKEWKR